MDRYTYKKTFDNAFKSTVIKRLKKLSSALAALNHRQAPFKEVSMAVVNRLLTKKANTAYAFISPVVDLQTKEVKYLLTNEPIYRDQENEAKPINT